MSILHFEIVFEKLAQATNAERSDTEDFHDILRAVDEVAELKKIALDVTDGGEQSYTTT